MSRHRCLKCRGFIIQRHEPNVGIFAVCLMCGWRFYRDKPQSSLMEKALAIIRGHGYGTPGNMEVEP